MAAAGLALAAWAAAPHALAWEDAGHQVVAAIAWAEMRPEARARAAELLAAAPTGIGLAEMAPAPGPPDGRARRHFLLAATWPDRLREADRATDSWHWINRFWRDTAEGPVEVAPPLPQPEENLRERLGVLSAQLADPARPAGERAVALSWMLHLVGDAHQPLHVSARITDHPDELRGDRGGNAFQLHTDPGTGRPLRLHAYWDRLLSSTLPRRAGEPWTAWIDRTAADLARRHPRSTLGPLSPGDFDAWIDEAAAIARTTVYRHGLERGQRPPRRYQRAAWAAAEPAIARAGYRLAALLDSALAGI